MAAADTASSNTGAKVIPWTTADLTKTDFLIAADVEVASSKFDAPVISIRKIGALSFTFLNFLGGY